MPKNEYLSKTDQFPDPDEFPETDFFPETVMTGLKMQFVTNVTKRYRITKAVYANMKPTEN